MTSHHIMLHRTACGRAILELGSKSTTMSWCKNLSKSSIRAQTLEDMQALANIATLLPIQN